jgi:formate dehydrogenase subunit gamma
MARRKTTSDRIRGNSIVRFGAHPRIQHALMICSFAVLAITGISLKYGDLGSSKRWVQIWGGVENLRVVHRYAAWVMVAVCVYHLIHVLFTVVIMRRPFPTAILPRVKDLRDFVQDMKHTFGLSKDAPKFDRFSYRNKGAYWLTFAGAFIMVATGLMLMYPVWTASHFAGWMSPLALVFHSDAAILAVGWMAIVHMYFAHFARHIFPMDKSIFTGKVPIERYRTEFPLEYARIMAAADSNVTTRDTTAPSALAGPPKGARPLPEKQATSDEPTGARQREGLASQAET